MLCEWFFFSALHFLFCNYMCFFVSFLFTILCRSWRHSHLNAIQFNIWPTLLIFHGKRILAFRLFQPFRSYLTTLLGYFSFLVIYRSSIFRCNLCVLYSFRSDSWFGSIFFLLAHRLNVHIRKCLRASKKFHSDELDTNEKFSVPVYTICLRHFT